MFSGVTAGQVGVQILCPPPPKKKTEDLMSFLEVYSGRTLDDLLLRVLGSKLK